MCDQPGITRSCHSSTTLHFSCGEKTEWSIPVGRDPTQASPSGLFQTHNPSHHELCHNWRLQPVAIGLLFSWQDISSIPGDKSILFRVLEDSTGQGKLLHPSTRVLCGSKSRANISLWLCSFLCLINSSATAGGGVFQSAFHHPCPLFPAVVKATG